MRYARLGPSGPSVSQCTLGTSPIERGAHVQGMDAALDLALACGVNAIELEAGGPAESWLAARIKDRALDTELHLISRVPSLIPFDLPSPHVPAFEAYPGTHVRAQTEASLKALGVERLGCQLIHAWCPEWLGEGDWLEMLQRLKEEGKIAAIGVSLFDHDCDAGLSVVASGAIDCIQLMYNIFDSGAAEALLPLCEQHGVGVIARSPLYFGALTQRIQQTPAFGPGDWRADYFFNDHLDETRARAGPLKWEAREQDGDVAELALRFAASHPTVTTVAVGMSSAEQAQQNLAALDRGRLTDEALARLTVHRWLC